MNIKFQTFCLLSLIQVIVCVCVCVYVHVHIIVYMSVSAYVCEHECVCVCMCVQFCVFSYSISNISNILSFISYVICTLPYFHSLVFHMFMKDIYQIQCIYSFLQDVCVCAQARIYTEKLLVIILPAKKFCKQYFVFTHSPLLFTVNHLHYKKVNVSIQCFTHFLNTISLHYKKKLIAFPYIWYKAFSFT